MNITHLTLSLALPKCTAGNCVVWFLTCILIVFYCLPSLLRNVSYLPLQTDVLNFCINVCYLYNNTAWLGVRTSSVKIWCCSQFLVQAQLINCRKKNNLTILMEAVSLLYISGLIIANIILYYLKYLVCIFVICLFVAGKYMQMMNVLKPIAFDVVICMSQLFDYYLFAVSITFICYEQYLYQILFGIKITLRQPTNDQRNNKHNSIQPISTVINFYVIQL